MAPVIRISNATYEKMKLLAEPFVDTPDAVISRYLDEALQMRGLEPNYENGSAPLGDSVVRDLDPDAPGELKHTSVKRARVNSQELSRPNWNTMLRYLHSVALEKLGSFSELLRATGANLREGRYEEDGFHYIPEADISIQGQDSNLSWENSLRLAKRLGIPLTVDFVWRQKEGAAHPGEMGRLQWEPKG